MLSLDPVVTDQNSPIPGERRLWAAVLAQAVYDLTGINTFTNRSYHTRIRYFARLWIDSDSRDAGSFRWVCDQLDLDPGWLRRRLLEIADRNSSVSLSLVRGAEWPKDVDAAGVVFETRLEERAISAVGGR
jgi:hypothetical protein